MFVDHIKIHAKAGDGGRGSVSFRREKFVPRGGPDGGDGGRGGDIILRASPHTDNLSGFFYEPIIKAKSGASGRGKKMYGRSAQSRIVDVPMGTLVYRIPDGTRTPANTAPVSSSNPEHVAPGQTEGAAVVPELELIADLIQENQEFILCKGGEGGKGNVHFKSSRNRVPLQYTEGVPGEEGYFFMELRKIADAGLVGYPNAGKSTLLGKISAAHPKVAAYPFTTLHPIVGVIEFPDFERATIADIPGLIEGAHRNVGLGHDFLRHIVRCKLLLFVLDMAGSEGRSPIEDLAKLREELKLYDPQLAQRSWIVVANKMDLPDAVDNLQNFKRRYPKIEILPISAEEETGLVELKNRLQELIRT